MPRQVVPGKEIKRRSRTGCHACKEKKVRCDETKPRCQNCEKHGRKCDYSIKLVWGGRPTKKKVEAGVSSGTEGPSGDVAQFSFESGLHTMSFEDPANGFSTNTPNMRGSSMSTFSQTPPVSEDADYHQLMPHLKHESPLLSGDAFMPAGQPNLQASLAYIQNSSRSQNMSSFQSSNFLTTPPIHPTHSRTLSAPSQAFNVMQASFSSYPETVPFDGSSLRSSLVDAPIEKPQHYRSKSFSPHNRSYPTPSPTVPSASLGARTETAYEAPSERSSKRPRTGDFSGFMPTQTLYEEQTNPFFPHSNYLSPGMAQPSPTTPLSNNSDEQMSSHQHESHPYITDSGNGVRRLSVESLLDGPPPAPLRQGSPAMSESSIFSIEKNPYHHGDTEMYGTDDGEPDLDIRVNNLDETSPPGIYRSMQLSVMSGGKRYSAALTQTAAAFKPGGYYHRPVSMKIPRSLLPLPDLLIGSRTNLLYFHHFLNHTAKVLSPHDCLRNPFRTLMPSMAVENQQLLNLLLAYSASHRSRLLEQPEPSERMSVYLEDAFRSLRLAMDDSAKRTSNSNLATAIMLCSLEIISPIPFEVPVPWQVHLKEARDIIILRGGARATQSQDKDFAFLCRWFAYLDVFGSLSGQKEQPVLAGSYWVNSASSSDEEFEIDCLLGFTPRCVAILAKVAHLARKCDEERHAREKLELLTEDWLPSDDTKTDALRLLAELEESRAHAVEACHHDHAPSQGVPSSQDNGGMPAANEFEMRAMNEAFHWAGLVHLHRRVLGKKSDHADVQMAVREIVKSLKRVAVGGTAEAGLLFPIFTAGCDATRVFEQQYILGRIASMEKSGLTQVRRAKDLMQKVWDTGRPWDVLGTVDFIG